MLLLKPMQQTRLQNLKYEIISFNKHLSFEYKTCVLKRRG